MIRCKTVWAAVVVALCGSAAVPLSVQADEVRAGGDFTTWERNRNAYQQIIWERVPPEQWDAVVQGRSLVRQTWVVSPSIDAEVAGLGPTYNRPSCISCHLHNGRGQPPQLAEESMRSMLVRLSVPGTDSHGGPKPHPHYGDQLNEFGVPSVPGEGEAFILWQSREETLDDGTNVVLRQPELAFRHLAFGSPGSDIMTSPRVAPPMFGLGLLDAVAEADILALAEAQRKEGRGIAGKPNRVWDVASGTQRLGRFGWKANQSTLRQQIAGAMAGDMGITSTLFPQPNCPEVQKACAAWHEDQHPELSDADLDAMTLYHFVLAVPARRNTEAPEVKRGEALFTAAGCAGCHQPQLKTAEFPAFPPLSGQKFHPYTDLLLHDMGDDLADGRPDYLADGRQWRTPPLWGLGLSQTVNEHQTLLHDGRARNPLEAILWHGGEASAARDSVRAMSKQDREALLAFLSSL